MNNQEKKTWKRPVIQVLNIKKDTFSGSQGQAENAGQAPTTKKGALTPTP